MLLLLGSPKNDENDFFDLGILASIADPILLKKSLKELAMSKSEVCISLLYFILLGGAHFFLETLIRFRIPSQVFLILPWFFKNNEV